MPKVILIQFPDDWEADKIEQAADLFNACFLFGEFEGPEILTLESSQVSVTS